MNPLVKTALCAACLVALALPAHAAKLPEPVAASIAKHFPDAKVEGVEREREAGVLYYEVELREGKKRFEVEVAPDGAIGEIESAQTLDDLPEDVRKLVTDNTKGARRLHIEKHERRGRAQGDTFAPLKRPTTFYGVTWRDKGKRNALRINLTPEGPKVTLGVDDDEEDDDEDEDEDEDD